MRFKFLLDTTIANPGNECFIPTKSSLDMGTGGLDFDVRNYFGFDDTTDYKEINSPYCPFDVIFVTDSNSQHAPISLIKEMTDFIEKYVYNDI